MQDFRSRLVKRTSDAGSIQELLDQGQLSKALRTAKSIGVTVQQEQIDRAAAQMVRQHRATELLSLVGGSDEVQLPYDTLSLLRAAFQARDYHGFLKQAHRLRIKSGLETEIEEAIGSIRRRAPNEADSWLRKFGAI